MLISYNNNRKLIQQCILIAELESYLWLKVTIGMFYPVGVKVITPARVFIQERGRLNS